MYSCYESTEFHYHVFCGPTILKPEYAQHECTTRDCPLHGRIIPRALEMDTGRIEALHKALDVPEKKEARACDSILQSVDKPAGERGVQ